YELKKGKIDESMFDFASLNFNPVTLEQLQGGDAFYNADIIRDVLNGTSTEAQRNIVLLNAAFGIRVSGKAETLNEAKRMSVESIDSGAANNVLKQMSEATNDVMEIS